MLQRERIRVSWKKTPCGYSGCISPFAEDMQKDVPSTNVTVPDPRGPAAVSAFHPVIPRSFSRMRVCKPRQDPSGRTARRAFVDATDATPVCSLKPVPALTHLITPISGYVASFESLRPG
jgi:hypothetical protein